MHSSPPYVTPLAQNRVMHMHIILEKLLLFFKFFSNAYLNIRNQYERVYGKQKNKSQDRVSKSKKNKYNLFKTIYDLLNRQYDSVRKRVQIREAFSRLHFFFFFLLLYLNPSGIYIDYQVLGLLFRRFNLPWISIRFGQTIRSTNVNDTTATLR